MACNPFNTISYSDTEQNTNVNTNAYVNEDTDPNEDSQALMD
jgi:hypothetical protein